MKIYIEKSQLNNPCCLYVRSGYKSNMWDRVNLDYSYQGTEHIDGRTPANLLRFGLLTDITESLKVPMVEITDGYTVKFYPSGLFYGNNQRAGERGHYIKKCDIIINLIKKRKNHDTRTR